ncbi:hypothetical protein HW555_003618, partial [Spodoptera exigua]
FITVLQLCRAEISDSLPESWYSANVISDGFQPKPISEIFSTGPPFSTTNPIVVLPKESSSVPDEILLLSTLAPPRKISTTGSSEFTKLSTAALESSTPLPSTFHTIPPSSVQTILPTTYQTTPSTFLPSSSTFLPPSSTFLPSPSTTRQPPIVTEPKETQPSSQSTFSFQQTTLSLPQPQPSPSSSNSAQTLSQQVRLELVPQGVSIQTNAPQSVAQPTPGPLSNYFLVYQQAPQSIQSFPSGTSQEVPQFSTASPSTSTGTPSTVIIQPAPSVSPPSTRTAPPSPTTPLPSTTRVQTRPTARIINKGCKNVTTNLPVSKLSELGPLKIRVLAPSGSITNVNFVAKTTTTKKPTTTRTRKTSKPKKNTYEFCIDGCRGKREPICAAPLSITFLDPKTLKGFPSVCHMACHNSYRKDPYEKVLDGRCGRLRTRIKTVDSNTKLKREELNKAQYFLDNSGTKTIVEVSPLK